MKFLKPLLATYAALCLSPLPVLAHLPHQCGAGKPIAVPVSGTASNPNNKTGRPSPNLDSAHGWVYVDETCSPPAGVLSQMVITGFSGTGSDNDATKKKEDVSFVAYHSNTKPGGESTPGGSAATWGIEDWVLPGDATISIQSDFRNVTILGWGCPLAPSGSVSISCKDN